MATVRLQSKRAVARGLIAVSSIAALIGLSACATPTATVADGEVGGTLQVLMPSGDSSDKAFRELNEAFEAKYPNVTVEFTSVPNESYVTAYTSRLTAGNVDVLMAGPTEVPDYASELKDDDAIAAEAGAFLDLNNEPFMENFTPSVVESIMYDGKSFGVPTGLSYFTGAYYNKTLFDELGLSIPTTWDEFIQLCDDLRAAGVSPLGIGGKDGWPVGMLMQAVLQGSYPTLDEKRELMAALWDGSIKLTDPEMLLILEKLELLYGYAQPNFAGVDYSAIPGEFAAGSVAMVPDGTWNAPTMKDAVGENFEFGYFPIPTSDNAEDNQTLAGKAEIRIAVVSATKNKTAALAWLDFYSDPVNYAKFVTQAGFVPAQPNIPSGDFLDSIQVYTATFEPAWETMWAPNLGSGPAATFPFNYPGIAPLGSEDAAQAAETSQADWSAGF